MQKPETEQIKIIMKKVILTLLLACAAVLPLSAQNKGDWGIGPRISIYTNAGAAGAISGVGATGRYSFTDNWRIEPSVTALCRDFCSVDLSVDVHYLFRACDVCSLYPQVGLSANDIFGWSCGIHLGCGTDVAIAHNWDLTADLRWVIQTARWHRNPIVLNFGLIRRF